MEEDYCYLHVPFNFALWWKNFMWSRRPRARIHNRTHVSIHGRGRQVADCKEGSTAGVCRRRQSMTAVGEQSKSRPDLRRAVCVCEPLFVSVLTRKV